MSDVFISQLVEENKKHLQAIERLTADLQQTIFILDRVVSLPIAGGGGENSSVLPGDAQAILADLKRRYQVV